MKSFLLLLTLPFLLIGCSTINKVQIPISKAVLLSSDRIYTIPANTEVTSLKLDGQEIGPIRFQYDMKLVAPDVLVAQEVKLNDAILNKVKADKNNSQMMQIFGGIIAFLTALAGIWIKIITTKKSE
jgi:hypothetical protein